ncbi:MAG: TRAP transporter small permease [Desulfobacterales bacterium]|nr:TRAP transporter small permease [Desulfobacterales bacterium]
MFRFEKLIILLANRFNWIAAGAIVAMMLLTSADVVLRLFRHPVPGTYEMVGFLGAVVISFSLAYTSVERGHIAVEFLFQKLPKKVKFFINAINDFLCLFLFGLLTWQTMLMAFNLKQSGEVSMTLQLPIYPFVFGISIGCGLLSITLLKDFLKSVIKVVAE